MHPLLEHLSSQEAQRRQRLEEARRAVETNPMQLQNALAEGLKTSVPAGSKIATKKFPTKLEAVEHAIPKDDPRSKLGTATWSRYKSMMQDPKYENFHPKDLLRVASEVESSLITEPLHKYAQEQHTGLWHSMFPGDVAPVPGQEEWEKAHPIEPIEHTGVLESAAYGAGGLAAWEAGKVALGKGAAAKPKYKVDPRSAAIMTREVPKVGRLGALKALGRFGPWGKLAAAGAVAVPSFYVFDEASQRSTRSLLETEWGAKHPNLSAMTGLAVGLAASAPIAFEGIFGDVLEKKLIHKETFSRIRDKLLDRDITAKRLNTFPTAKNIMLLRSVEKELLKDTEDIGRAIQKDRDKVVTNLIDIISKRVEEKRFGTPALPAPGAPTSPAGEAIPMSGRLLGEGMTSGPAAGLRIPGRAIPLSGRTGFPPMKPEGPIQPYTGLKYLGEGKYTAGDIKTQEGLDRVLEEISLGKTKDEAVQLVGEMENGIERRFTVKEKVTPTIGPRLRASLKELGYEDKEIDFLKYDKAVWLRDTTKAIAKSTERKKVVGNILESDVGVKKSKIDVSGLTQEEKQLQWARTLSPQRRYDAVSKGILSEDINRKITLKQKSKVEKGEEYETFWKSVKEEEDAALESLGGMDRTILSTEGEVKTFDLDSYEKAKKTFVERMMAGKAAPIAGTAAVAGAAYGAKPESAEASYIGTLGKVSAEIQTALQKALKAHIKNKAVTRDSSVRAQTGWFKGPDSQWRFEISDKNAIVIPKFEKDTKLSIEQVYKHDKLYEIYPQLKNIKVEVSSKRVAGSGEYNRDTNEIILGAAPLPTLKKVMAHELQHAVQGIEGFARGGSPAGEIAGEMREAARIVAKSKDKSLNQVTKAEVYDYISRQYGSSWTREELYEKLLGEVEAKDVGAKSSLDIKALRGRIPYDSQTAPFDVVEVIKKGDRYISKRIGSVYTFESFKEMEKQFPKKHLKPVKPWLGITENDLRIKAQGSDKNMLQKSTVYHGSPRIWPPEPGFPHGRPRLDKVLTGEGAVAYGHGWYSADVDKTARTYLQKDTGSLYKLDLPDDVLPKLLDWDKPLSQQSEYVKKALEKINPSQYPELSEILQHSRSKDVTGGQFYRAMETGTTDEGDMGAFFQERMEKETSEFFASIGIPGNKYLDATSRVEGKGTSNYVVWDQGVLDRVALLERNGEKLDAIRMNSPETNYIGDAAAKFKPATEEEASTVAKNLGLKYEGVQSAFDKNLFHVFTDLETKSTFASTSANPEDVGRMLAENQARFKESDVLDKVKGALAAAAVILPLTDILSPRQAEAAGIPDAAGRVVTEAVGRIIKEANPVSLPKLLKGMKDSGIIPKQRVSKYIDPEPMEAIELVPNLKHIRENAANLPSLMESTMTPMAEFHHYFGYNNGRELMNNPAVQWANGQSAATRNTTESQTTLQNILRDFIPGYKSSAKNVIKEMKPLVDKYHKPMQERAYHFAMADYFEKLSAAEWKKIGKKSKFSKKTEDQAMNALEILEGKARVHKNALKESEGLVAEYQNEWKKVVEPMSLRKENSGVRVFLAAEDTANFEFYPWLKDRLSYGEKAAAAKIKDQMETYGVRVLEAGEKVISTRPFMHWAWHPDMNNDKIINSLKKQYGTVATPPMTKLHSRSAGFLPMVPDAEYSATTYFRDINLRLEAMKFWKTGVKGEGGGWWNFERNLLENPDLAPPGLREAFRAFKDGFKPYERTTMNEWAERMYAVEVARLLAGSASVPFKHALKIVATTRIFGPVESLKAVPKAISSSLKSVFKQKYGRDWLERKGWKVDALDEAVDTFTETGKLYRIIADISPFRVNQSRGDKLLQQFNQIGGSPVSAVERFDRAMVVVAATKMAAKKGMTPAQATYAVYDTILKANFLSGSLNPGWLRNPAVRLMLIFQGTPYKIMEQRAMMYKRGGDALLNTVRQLRDDVVKGEKEFKWEMVRQGLSSEKDLFGTPILAQCMREMMLVGTSVATGLWMFDSDLLHHFLHLPFLKAGTKDIMFGTPPVVGAALRTQHEMGREDYEDFPVSTFFKSWFGATIKGVPAPIPVVFQKALKLSWNDIPEIYRDSKLRYLFAIPAQHEH